MEGSLPPSSPNRASIYDVSKIEFQEEIESPVKQSRPYLDTLPGIVICLDENKGKRVSGALSSVLGEVITPISEFVGTDGREASRTGIFQPPKRTNGGILHSLFSVPASDAISDSHMRAWEYFLTNTNANMCAFFEDDAFIEEEVTLEMATERLRGALSEIQDATPPCDVLFLGHFESPVFVGFHRLLGKLTLKSEDAAETKFTREPEVAVGAHAYILSRDGAHKALIEAAAGQRTLHTSDFFLQTLASQGLIQTRVLCDRLVFQTSTAYPFSSSTSPGNQIADWARNLGLDLPTTHFPMLLCDVVFGKRNADKYVSAKYVMAFEIGRLFRLPALSVTIGSLILLAITCAALIASATLPVGVFGKQIICIVTAALIALVLAPDLVISILSTTPVRSLLKVVFHAVVLIGPLVMCTYFSSVRATALSVPQNGTPPGTARKFRPLKRRRSPSVRAV